MSAKPNDFADITYCRINIALTSVFAISMSTAVHSSTSCPRCTCLLSYLYIIPTAVDIMDSLIRRKQGDLASCPHCPPILAIRLIPFDVYADTMC